MKLSVLDAIEAAAKLAGKSKDEFITEVNKISIPTKTRVTYVAYVLDESGSMSLCKQATIEGYNSSIRDLRNIPAEAGEVVVSLVTLGGYVRVQQENKPLEVLQPLTDSSYTPQGGTPLYDAILRAIDIMSPRYTANPNSDVAFVVNVFTDGEENASTAGARERLMERVTALQNTGKWTFTVSGANINLTDLARQTGMLQSNMIQYSSTPIGTQLAYSNHKNAQQNYFAQRAVGTTASTGYYDPVQTIADQAEMLRQRAEEQRQIDANRASVSSTQFKQPATTDDASSDKKSTTVSS